MITEQLVGEVFGLRCKVVVDEAAGTPHVLHIRRHVHLPSTDAAHPVDNAVGVSIDLVLHAGVSLPGTASDAVRS